MITKLIKDWNELQKNPLAYNQADKKIARWNEEYRILKELQKVGCRVCPAGMMFAERDQAGMPIETLIEGNRDVVKTFLDHHNGTL